MNNNREWFMAHKKDYTDFLYEPMKALGKDLFEPFLQKPGSLLKVSRIYRDARLHHPLPYKESLWICIRQDVQWWAENPCLYFEIQPEGVSYGFVLWRPHTSTMEAFRKDIADNPKPFLKMIRKVERETGMKISADLYKRPKAAPTPELERFYAWKGNISCVQEEPVGPEMFGPDLGVRAKELLEKLIPLYDYFCRFSR